MVVFTDVSYYEPSQTSFVHVGLVITDNGRIVFQSAFTLTINNGECPEDTAISAAMRMFPDAERYCTDYISSKDGTWVPRKHACIQLCDAIARAKRRSFTFKQRRCRKRQVIEQPPPQRMRYCIADKFPLLAEL